MNLGCSVVVNTDWCSHEKCELVYLAKSEDISDKNYWSYWEISYHIESLLTYLSKNQRKWHGCPPVSPSEPCDQFSWDLCECNVIGGHLIAILYNFLHKLLMAAPTRAPLTLRSWNDAEIDLWKICNLS